MVFNCDMDALKCFVKEAGLTTTAMMLSVSVQRLANWIDRGVPVDKCAVIEQSTGGKVMRWDLRPNDWREIWPELAEHPNAPAKQATETIAGGV